MEDATLLVLRLRPRILRRPSPSQVSLEQSEENADFKRTPCILPQSYPGLEVKSNHRVLRPGVQIDVGITVLINLDRFSGALVI